MSNTEIEDAIWPAPDGSMWIYTAAWEEWTGWEPGIDGHFQYTIEQFRAGYPDAPDWDENERKHIEQGNGGATRHAGSEADGEHETGSGQADSP